jgi:hypothetical protein
MKLDFEYDFSLLNAVRLQQEGIKSFKEVKEVFEDEFSQFELLREQTYPILSVIGFTDKSKPIKVAFSNIKGVIFFLDARTASKQEVINEFCKYCK